MDKPIEVILRFRPRHEIIPLIHLLVPQEVNQSGQFPVVLSLDRLGLTGIRSRLIDFSGADLRHIFKFQRCNEIVQKIGNRDILRLIATTGMIKRLP